LKPGVTVCIEQRNAGASLVVLVGNIGEPVRIANHLAGCVRVAPQVEAKIKS
jgi:hypothetical protein